MPRKYINLNKNFDERLRIFSETLGALGTLGTLGALGALGATTSLQCGNAVGKPSDTLTVVRERRRKAF